MSKKKRSFFSDLPPDHPAIVARRLLGQTVGRLPSRFVFLLAGALVIAVVFGVLVRGVQSPKPDYHFLGQRIEAVAGQPDVSANLLQGVWTIQGPQFSMSLQFSGSVFEWNVRGRKDPYGIYFARGNYKTAGNVLILGQRPDLGVPHNPDEPALRYFPLPLRDTNVYVRLVGNEMEWIFPAAESDRLAIPMKNFLVFGPNHSLTWARQK